MEADVNLETYLLTLLIMIANWDIPDFAMFTWIAFFKMFNPKLKHIVGKDNPIADMLFIARYFSQEYLKHATSMSMTSEDDYE